MADVINITSSSSNLGFQIFGNQTSGQQRLCEQLRLAFIAKMEGTAEWAKRGEDSDLCWLCDASPRQRGQFLRWSPPAELRSEAFWSAASDVGGKKNTINLNLEK